MRRPTQGYRGGRPPGKMTGAHPGHGTRKASQVSVTPRAPGQPHAQAGHGVPGGGAQAPAAGGGPRTIRRGDAGADVAYAQNLLNARHPGHVLWVDGLFGPATDRAVRQYQARGRLAVDGIVGPDTWESLEAGPPPIEKRPRRA